MSEMLLLGAGASKEADVPDTYGMTSKIADFFRQDPGLERHARVISFVIGGLLFQQGIKGEDPLEASVNVEELFNAVQLLAGRNSLEAAPFVGSWHPMVQDFDRVRSPSPQLGRLYRMIYEGVTKEILSALPPSPPAFAESDIDRELGQTIKTTVDSMVKGRGSYSSSTKVGRRIGDYVMRITKEWMDRLRLRTPQGGYAFEQEFRNAVEGMKDRPGEGEIFSQTAELMIRALANIVWIDRGERVQHLAPLSNLVAAQKQVTIATLNYDNGIELLAQTAGISTTTGIDDWSKGGSFIPRSIGIFLLKLHGSIDWALIRNQRSDERPMPHSVIQQVTPAKIKEAGFRPAVIFGQRNKLTAEGPFLDLLRAFQQELSRSSLLTVVGYSFRDDHVNEYISQWLNQSKERRLRVISPQFDHSSSPYAQQLIRFGVGRLEIIRECAGPGLAKLYPVPASIEAPASPPAGEQSEPPPTT
jgi:hypothetical protein